MNRIDNFMVIGFSYKEHTIEDREKFIKEIKPRRAAEEIFGMNKNSSVLVIDTCLRTEFYIYSEKIDIDKIKTVFKNYREQIYIYSGKDAVRHLFVLSCGLDSAIPGEDQILAQIKKRYLDELEKGNISREMNVIFNNGVSLGKKFRNVSRVSCMPLSLENIAVKYLEAHMDIYNKKIFVIGTGDLNREIIRILIKKRITNIAVTNRSHGKSIDIAGEFGLKSVDFSERYEAVNRSDIIISATSAPHYVIHKDEYRSYCTEPRQRLFVDLAVPRDIEPDIEDENNKLINIENLNNTAEKNIVERRNICKNYTYLVNEQMLKCFKWFERGK